MPPTIQAGGRDDKRSRGTGEKRSELVCRVKYNNSLPDIPFDPKFITYPFDSNRFVQYNPTSLERNYKHELLTEIDLGVTIDLINPETYKPDHGAYLDEADEKLLEEEVNTPQDSKRSRNHRHNVSWLRKTEYISTEYNRFIQSNEKAESRVGYTIKKYFKEEDLYRDRESQINAIENTFNAVKVPVTKHYSKPSVVPVNIMPVYPDFELWKYPCAQVIFDADPAPFGRTHPAQMEEMSQAMIRGMVDESGDQFVAYFLPTAETLEKRKRDAEIDVDYEEEEEYDYKLAREYNWTVKNKASRGYEESYFFVVREDGVYYNELETKVRLSKRRKLGSATMPKTRLVVKHRSANEQEIAAQTSRMSMLEPPGEEEEEEAGGGEGMFEGAQKSGDEDNAAKSGDEASHESGDEADKKSAASVSSSEAEGSPRGSPQRRGSVGSRSSSGSSSSSSSDSGSSGSGSESGSESESEAENKKSKKRKAEEEIFGGSSDED